MAEVLINQEAPAAQEVELLLLEEVQDQDNKVHNQAIQELTDLEIQEAIKHLAQVLRNVLLVAVVLVVQDNRVHQVVKVEMAVQEEVTLFQVHL